VKKSQSKRHSKKSTVAKATSDSDSLRATIPKEVAKGLQPAPGHVLDWETESERGKKCVRMSKLE
jgi:hypothetical protein